MIRTPGPWHLEPDTRYSEDSPTYRIRGEGSELIAAVNLTGPTGKANGQLLAAAPALLAVCEAAADYLMESHNHLANCTRGLLLAAIKQATGEE